MLFLFFLCHIDFLPIPPQHYRNTRMRSYFKFSRGMILLSLSLFRCFISSEACQIMFVSLCRCGCWQAGREIHHDIRGSVSQALPKPPPLRDWWTAGWGTFVLEILYMKWYMKLEKKCCVLFVLFFFMLYILWPSIQITECIIIHREWGHAEITTEYAWKNML